MSEPVTGCGGDGPQDEEGEDYFSVRSEQVMDMGLPSPFQRRLAARNRPRSPLVPEGAKPRYGYESDPSRLHLPPQWSPPPRSSPSTPTVAALPSIQRAGRRITPLKQRGIDIEAQPPPQRMSEQARPRVNSYTEVMRHRPPLSFWQQLKPYHGRLSRENWLRAAVRPFVLLSYPAVVWSAAVYSFSMGWLIVISESIAVLFMQRRFHLSAIHMGMMYISPLVCSILGTAVTGVISDAVVQFMARCNRGVYEPEFRLVMVLPAFITTVAGLIGYGWTAERSESVVPPALMFGLVGFGTSLGSTTAITFVLDSYREHAGEALVALNFCKNVLHGMVFSFFVVAWIVASGSRRVFMWLGVMHALVLLTTVPMYIYGKRARMWTVRHNFVERFWRPRRSRGEGTAGEKEAGGG